jgi:hypothetical protein
MRPERDTRPEVHRRTGAATDTGDMKLLAQGMAGQTGAPRTAIQRTSSGPAGRGRAGGRR